MSHKAQRDFCHQVKYIFPKYFKRVNVIDVGSMDMVNLDKQWRGNIRGLFFRSHYVGIDLMEGNNVDVIGRAHEIIPTLIPKLHSKDNGVWSESRGRLEHRWDVMASTEALEHDRTYSLTLVKMYEYLRRGGLMFITCAGEGRREHGTDRHDPECSPATTDYYKNVTMTMFSSVLPPDLFTEYLLRTRNEDLQFYGIKR